MRYAEDYVPREKKNGPRLSILSVVSLILAGISAFSMLLELFVRDGPRIDGVWFIPAFVSLAVAIVSLILIRLRPDKLQGTGYAIAALVISLLLIGYGWHSNLAFQKKMISVCCLNNMQRLGIAMQMYAQENDGYLPPPGDWVDAVKPFLHLPQQLYCPAEPDRSAPSYAMNENLAGYKLDDPAIADCVLLFESFPGQGLSGGPELFLAEPRHRDDYTILRGNGAVVHVDDPQRLKWNPDTPSE